jgi:hypothetical protein
MNIKKIISWILILTLVVPLINVELLKNEAHAETVNTYKVKRGGKFPREAYHGHNDKVYYIGLRDSGNRGTVLPDGRVYIMQEGGFHNKTKAYIFDPNTENFESRTIHPIMDNPDAETLYTPALTTLKNNEVAAINGYYSYDLGYRDISRNIEDIYIYNTINDIWTKRFTELPSRNRYTTYRAATTMPDGKVLVSGGLNEKTSQYYNRTKYSWILDLETGRESKLNYEFSNEEGFGYAGMRAITLPDGNALVFGGSKRDGQNLNIFKYDKNINDLKLIKNLRSSFSNRNMSVCNYAYIGDYKILVSSKSGNNPDYKPTSLDKAIIYDCKNNTVTPVSFPNGDKFLYSFYKCAWHLKDGRTMFLGNDGYIYYLQPNHAPTIDITAPNNEQVFHKGKNINVNWTTYDEDGDNLTHTIKIGTTSGGSDLYSGNPNGTTNNSSGSHILNTNNISLNWNNSHNRYERRIYVTTTVSDGNESATSQKSFLIVNYKPSITVSTSQNIHAVNYKDPFTISGKVWDSYKDAITVKATINGKTVTDTVNPSPSSPTSGNNFSLTWQGTKALDEGQYHGATLTIIDSNGASFNYTWNGTVLIKDVLKTVDNEIKDKIDLGNDYDLKMVVANSEAKISQSTRNDNYLNSIGKGLKNRDSVMYFIGDKDSKSYISNALNSHVNNRYGNKTDNNKQGVSDYVLDLLGANANSNVFLVDDFVDFRMSFEDAERDYEGISVSDKLKSNDAVD